MNTSVILPTPANIQRAATLIMEGELVAFPTETVYGLGANALDAASVTKIFVAKGRPADNPLIVHVATPEAAEPLCEIDSRARALMARFWPGPLTLLLPKKSAIPTVTNAGLSSVAIRMPSHPVALALLRACQVPIAAPSANTSGRPSPTTAQHVLDDLNGKVELILDGGACTVGLESTVLNLEGEIPTIVRPGGVTQEMLQTVLGPVDVADSVMRPLRTGEKAISPGMMYRHYAPHGRLTLVKGAPERVWKACCTMYDEALQVGHKACILAYEEHQKGYGNRRTLTIGSLTNPESIAHSLFAALRQMDDEGMQVILCETVEAEGIGLAIMNRMSRAAAFHVLDVGTA